MRCISACPTDALNLFEIDATKCISYLTIEHRGEIPSELQKKMGSSIVGCDICQDVCPWNNGIPLSKEERFDPRPGNFQPSFASLAKMTRDDFSQQFRKSPVKRVKHAGLMRNVEIVKKSLS